MNKFIIMAWMVWIIFALLSIWQIITLREFIIAVVYSTIIGILIICDWEEQR